MRLNWLETASKRFGFGPKRFEAVTDEGRTFAYIYPAFTGTVEKEDWGPQWGGEPYMRYWPCHPHHAIDDDQDDSVWFVILNDLETPSSHQESLLDARSLIYHHFQIYCKALGLSAVPQPRIEYDTPQSDLSWLDAHMPEAAHIFTNIDLGGSEAAYSAFDADIEAL